VGSAIPAIEANATGSAITGSRITVEAIEGFGIQGESGTGRGASDTVGGGSSSGGALSHNDYRSDASLLAVVRRYAPGIQFCYDNELKKRPGLKGKLVVSITVAPSGKVMEASLVQESLGSKDLVACALAQIEAWKFESIPDGVVTFHAPFVFSAPE
jgi:TonB family protein